MSCEAIRLQLNEFANGLEEGHPDHALALSHAVIVRSACDHGTHTSKLSNSVKVAERMAHYTEAAGQFLSERGVMPQSPKLQQ